MQAVVPKAVRAALMMAASISSPYLSAFFVAVLITVSSLYRFAVCLSTRKNKKIHDVIDNQIFKNRFSFVFFGFCWFYGRPQSGKVQWSMVNG